MKTSFTTFACTGWGLDQILEAAVENRYQGVEFRVDADHLHGVEVSATAEQRGTIRARLADANIEPCCLATSLQFASDQVIDEAPARIDLAADIGAPALRVLCGPMPDGESMVPLIEKVGRQLRLVAEQASQAGVELWLETHDTFARGADAAAAVRRADHPSVGIVYNNAHPFRRGEAIEITVAVLSGLVRHVHFHDAVNSPDKVIIKPIGKGELPIDEMFQALFMMGFDGYLSGEWFHNQYGDDPETALRTYKQDIEQLTNRFGVELGA